MRRYVCSFGFIPPPLHPATWRHRYIFEGDAQSPIFSGAPLLSKGEVTKATVVRGPEELREAAVAAVQQWHYKPLEADFIVTVDVNYKLRAKKEAPKS